MVSEDHSRKLYSHLFKSQAQPDIPPNARNNMSQQQTQQQQHFSYQQAAMQQPTHVSAEVKAPPAVQSSTQQKQMGSHSFQGANSNYPANVPPRMQQQQQMAANNRLQSVQRSPVPPQRDPVAAASPKTEGITDGEKKAEPKDVDVAAQGTTPQGKRVRQPTVQPKPAHSNEMVRYIFFMNIIVNDLTPLKNTSLSFSRDHAFTKIPKGKFCSCHTVLY